MTENKLQIRAKVLSAIVGLQNNSQNVDFIKQTIKDLSEISDKSTLLSVLSKEFLKENSEIKDYTIAFLMNELINKEALELHLFELLANPKIKDSIKAKVVSVLRENGKHVNYEQYVNYFENPDEIIDADTAKLLENARVNPESQIDFLDFMNALPDEEKEMLVTSLADDYDGDNLANILIPIILSQPYSDISQIAIKSIGETKSHLAYPVLKWLEENIDELSVKANIQKSLSLLKLSGVKEDITKEYYKKLLENSPVYKCLMNYPDGHGNNGIIFSRKNEAGFIQMFALVINDIDGIIDCFGFNEISEGEFNRILKKFYINENIVEISPEICKYFICNAEKISRLKFKEISYEYIAWKSIINDIDYNEIDLTQNLKKVNLDEKLLNKLYEKSYFDKWFITTSDNEEFDKLTDTLVEKKSVSAELFLEEAKKVKDQIFTPVFLQHLNRRLVVSSYLDSISFNEFESSLLYSLTDDTEIKELFLTDILKKSIYEFFLNEKERYESLQKATTIFAQKANKDSAKIDIDFVKKSIKEIEEKWA